MRRFHALLSFLLLAGTAGAQATVAGSMRTHNPAQSYTEFEALTPTHPAAPFFGVKNGQWNTSQSYDPCIPDPTADPIVMLFSGMAAPVETGVQAIGRATISQAAFAANPSAWVQDAGNPVITVGSAGQPDNRYIRQSSCLYNPDDGGKLYEYYTCHDRSVDQMCLAISSAQGQAGTWTKYGVVLNPTIDGCSDETWVSQGAVMRRGPGDWIMVYSWRNQEKGVILPGLRYATSTDGKTWHGAGCKNIFTVAPEYLEQHQIFMLGGQCVLLYETGNNTTIWTIHSAVASRCEGPFTEGRQNPFLAPTLNKSTWDAYEVATPWYFVVKKQAYLLYSATSDSNTDYNVNHYPLGIATVPGVYHHE